MNQEPSGRAYYIFTFAVWAVYLVAYLAAPSEAAGRYGLSAIQLGLLKMSVAMPLLVIWMVAVYGLRNLQRYVRLIKGGPDGQGFRQLFLGVLMLVIGVFTTAFTGQLITYGLRHGRVEEAVILHNYLQVLFPLGAFILVYAGTRHLIRVAHAEVQSARQKWPVFFAFLFLAPLYTWLVFHDPNRIAPTTEGVVRASHYLPDPIILTTQVFPYLAAWALGLTSLLNIRTYGRMVKGQIYRQALKRFLLGIGFVVAFSISLQILSTLSGAISRLGLRAVLLLVYLLLAAYAIGYVLIALGSKQLAEIEEVQ